MRGARGLQLSDLFRDDSNDVRKHLELEGFSRGKLSREAVENAVVDVKN